MVWVNGFLDDAIETMRNGVNCKQNKSQKGVRISRIETISEAVINLNKVGYCELSEDQKQKYLLRSGDILFSHINSPIHVGKTAIHDGVNELYHGVNLMLLRCEDGFSAKYINYYLYYLFSNNYWLTVCKQSVNQASVNQTDIKKVPLKYPPLPEQKQIVEILDAAFAGIDKAIENTQANLANAQELFDNYLNAIFTKQGDGWEHKAFEVCLDKTKNTNKIPRKQFLTEGEYPIISQEAEFINGYWNKQIDLFKVNTPVVVYGDHTQVLKYVDFDFVMGVDGVKIFQPKSFINTKYLYYFLHCNKPKTLGYARHYRLLKQIDVSFPDIKQQEKIADDLDALYSKTTSTVAKFNKKLNLLNELKQTNVRSRIYQTPLRRNTRAIQRRRRIAPAMG